MKNDNNVLFSRSSDEWETPQYLFDLLNEKYHFMIDIAASDENHKCNWYITKYTDGLLMKWPNSVWCNPPYSSISSWVGKAFMESKTGSRTVMLIPSRTDTRWFHNFIYNKPSVSIEFIKGRLRFSGAKYNAPFPSMIVIFHPIDYSQLQQKLF